VKRNAWSRGLSVTAGGTGVVALAGSAAVRLLADRIRAHRPSVVRVVPVGLRRLPDRCAFLGGNRQLPR